MSAGHSGRPNGQTAQERDKRVGGTSRDVGGPVVERARAAYRRSEPMSGGDRVAQQENATYRYRRTAVLSVAGAEAPVVVTSDQIDDQLAGTYQRLGMRRGMLQRIAGIIERRWWSKGMTFADGAAMAG